MLLPKEHNTEVFDKVKKLGYSNIVATIHANRLTNASNVEAILRPTIEVVPSLDCLLDARKGANIIYDHLIRGSNIVHCSDSDLDKCNLK